MRSTYLPNVDRRGRTVGLTLLALVAACGAVLSAVPAPARAAKAEKQGEVTKAVLDVSALRPGKSATVAVVFDIKPGFHAQSATAREIDESLIPFTAKATKNDAMSFGDPVFPPGKIIPFQVPSQLSVYEGQVVVRIPVKVNTDAPLGPTKIAGKLNFQICDDNTCFAPESAPFSVDTEIVAADKAVEPANQDLFQQATRTGAAAPAGPAGAGGVKVANSDAPTYSLLGGL